MIYTNLKLIYLNIFAGMTCVVDKYSLDELNEEIPLLIYTKNFGSLASRFENAPDLSAEQSAIIQQSMKKRFFARSKSSR